MVEIDIYKPIDKEDPFMSLWFGDDWVFSADNVHIELSSTQFGLF